MGSVLVTGGSGFIGSHTCLMLLEQGYNVYVVDSHVNSSPKSIDRVLQLSKQRLNPKPSKLELIEGDLRNKSLLKEIFINAKKQGREIDSVIHFAGLKSVKESVLDPLLYWDNNVIGTINLIQVMDSFGCRRIVFSSSATIYGKSSAEKIKENCVIKPINPYGETKAAIEKILANLSDRPRDPWRVANLRYFNPIGAHPSGLIGEDPLGKPNNIFPIINQVAYKNLNELMIYGSDWGTPDGTGIRDYIHIMDLVEGHILALNYLFKGEEKLITLNLGTGNGTSVLALVNTFQEVNDVEIPYSFQERREGDVSVTIADNGLSLKLLNWCPKRTLEEMCKDGWEWQKSNPNGYE